MLHGVKHEWYLGYNIGEFSTLVIYTMNGRQYARSKPNVSAKRKKQLAKSSQAINFGMVSRYGTALLRVLKDYLRFPFTLATYNAARGWMLKHYGSNCSEKQWPLCSQYNTTCELNSQANLRDFLKACIEVTDEGNRQIRIQMDEINPVKQVPAPTGTMAVNIKWILLSGPIDKKVPPIESCMEEYSIPYTNAVFPLKQVMLALKGNEDDLAVVVLALEFEIKNKPFSLHMKDTARLPAAIVAMGKWKGTGK